VFLTTTSVYLTRLFVSACRGNLASFVSFLWLGKLVAGSCEDIPPLSTFLRIMSCFMIPFTRKESWGPALSVEKTVRYKTVGNDSY